jgi:uncharacterized protein (TIGR02001 family)
MKMFCVQFKGVCLGMAILAAPLALPASAVAQAPTDAKTELKYTFNVGIASDYVFRGYSQTARRGAVSGGVDLTYGQFYAGVAASSVHFGRDIFNNSNIAVAEVDLYAGYKPVVGPITFDIGAIYYAYPSQVFGATHTFENLNYLEGKLGASGEIWKGGTLSATAFYSPTYQAASGSVTTLEGSLSHAFSEINGITPTLSGLVGYQKGNSSASYLGNFGNLSTSYTYWNAGINLGFLEKYAIDIRYWDSNLSKNAGGSAYCRGQTFQCTSTLMGAFKVTF